MAATLPAWIRRLSSLGVDERQPAGEQRRVRLTNQSAMIGAVSCGLFAIGYGIAGVRFLAPMIANVLAVLSLCGALVLATRGRFVLARVAVLLPINLVVVVASMLLGARVGLV